MRKILVLFCSLFVFVLPAFNQSGKTLTLTEAYRQAEAGYALNARLPLLEQASALRMKQIDIQRLPEVSLNAQGRFQTENVSLPFEFPGREPIKLPLVSTQATIDGQYTLYDGGVAEARRQLERAGLEAERQGIQVELYPLREQVNRAFFGVLLLRAREQVLLNSLENLRARAQQLEAGVRHGTVLESSFDRLQVEILRLEAQVGQVRGDQRATLAILSDLTGSELAPDVALELPLSGEIISGLDRPELKLFELQKSRILANEQMLTATRRPKIGAFAQAGVGYPNPLNFFDETLSPFAVAGVRLTWKIFDWDQSSVDRQLLSVQSQLVDNQRAVFEENVQRQDGRFREDVETIERLIVQDEAIVALQDKILTQISAQLDHGVITPADYIDQVNAVIQARLNQETHRLQLQQVRVDYLTIKGLLK